MSRQPLPLEPKLSISEVGLPSWHLDSCRDRKEKVGVKSLDSKWCAKWWSTFQLIQRSTKIAVLLGGVPVAAGAQALAAV